YLLDCFSQVFNLLCRFFCRVARGVTPPRGGWAGVGPAPPPPPPHITLFIFFIKKITHPPTIPAKLKGWGPVV
ncbi:hypothetical protein ACVGXU_16630, partial [Enterobacter hormaechei]